MDRNLRPNPKQTRFFGDPKNTELMSEEELTGYSDFTEEEDTGKTVKPKTVLLRDQSVDTKGLGHGLPKSCTTATFTTTSPPTQSGITTPTNTMSSTPGPSQTHYVKQLPTNFRKFDGQEQNLASWFRQSEHLGKHPITQDHNDEATIQAALSGIDWDLPDNPAVWIAGDASVTGCTSWEEFKSIFQEGICERSSQDIFSLFALWGDLRLSSDMSVNTFLDSQNRFAGMAKDTLPEANFSDKGDDFSSDAVVELFKTTCILRELTPQVRKKVLGHHPSPTWSTVALKALITKEGGFRQQSVVRTTTTSGSGSGSQGKTHKSSSHSKFKKQSKSKSEKVSSVPFQPPVCFTCVKVGHLAKDCPYASVIKAKKQGKKDVQTASASSHKPETSKYCPHHHTKKHNWDECKSLMKRKEEVDKLLASCAPPEVTKA